MMEREPRIPDAIARCVPNVGFAWDEERGIILWESEEAQPTQAEIDAMMVTLQEEWDAEEYARNREAEYPSIAELTVALYDTDDKAAIETKRAAVKTKWPKDNSGPVE